jgi:chromosome partitioning protein
MKSGQVLSAQAPGCQGVDAFFRLFDPRYVDFRVYRMSTPQELPEPIGPLYRLLAELKTRAPRSATAVSVPVPAPPPSRPETRADKQPPPPPPAKSTPSRITVQSPSPRAATSRPTARPESGERPFIVAVASPKGGVGKTTISLNLSLSLARHGYRTVLVDGDINGDVMSSIDARDRPKVGAYDVILEGARLQDCLLRTTIDEYTILPAAGKNLPDPAHLMGDLSGGWFELGQALLADNDVVIIDTPAGTFGPSYSILRACGYIIGVLQAEPVAHRSFSMFLRSLETLHESERPLVAGIVLNMLQTSEEASVEVLRESGVGFPSEWLFDVTIPRNPFFLRASQDGLPLGFIDEKNPPAVAWLFDGLASELAERLQLPAPAPKPRRLLL